jgi:hypothetical protein
MKNKRTFIEVDYPVRDVLITYKTFENDEERTKWFQNTIKRKPHFDNGCHHWSDYVVEKVESLGSDYQYWVIGS